MSASVPTRPRPPVSGDGSGGWDGGDRNGGRTRRAPPEPYRLGMFFALAGIGMLFVALTSAYVVRLGMASQRGGLAAPAILWVNSAVLLASSVTLERARRGRARDAAAAQRWIQATLLLGLAFLAGQLALWRLLAAQGIYLASNPHSSFLYLLTALHGLHLLGGIAALSYVAFRAGNAGLTAPAIAGGRDMRRAADATALYWHFMDGLWLYLVLLLFVWR